MRDFGSIAHRVRARTRARNRELALEAIIEQSIGALFTTMTIGFIFGFTWLIVIFSGGPFGLARWQFAGLVAGTFLLVTFISAWRRVDPLGGVSPLSPGQEMATLISLATPGVMYFSPRHASAGAAALLIGGPENILNAFGTWRHRLPTGGRLYDQAAGVLVAAEAEPPASSIEQPRAAILLSRLALIKVVSTGSTAKIMLTEKGRLLLQG